MNETTVTVVGNVATDMSTRRVGTEGHLLVGFRVASSQRRFDRTTQSWTDGDRFSAWVSCWRRVGEGVVTSLVKGDPVVVTGRLSVREYEAGGERRYSTEIAATAVGPDLARSSAVVTRRRSESAAEAGDRPVVTRSDAVGEGLTPMADEVVVPGATESGAAALGAPLAELVRGPGAPEIDVPEADDDVLAATA